MTIKIFKNSENELAQFVISADTAGLQLLSGQLLSLRKASDGIVRLSQLPSASVDNVDVIFKYGNVSRISSRDACATIEINDDYVEKYVALIEALTRFAPISSATPAISRPAAPIPSRAVGEKPMALSRSTPSARIALYRYHLNPRQRTIRKRRGAYQRRKTSVDF